MQKSGFTIEILRSRYTQKFALYICIFRLIITFVHEASLLTA